MPLLKTAKLWVRPTPQKLMPAQSVEDFAESIEANSVHGSDAPETAAEEIKFFFSDDEIIG